MWGLLQDIRMFTLTKLVFMKTLCYNRNYFIISTHIAHIWQHLLIQLWRTSVTHTHAHLYMDEQPLLHTCREQASQLSFVFESGLRLSTVTTHPSSHPCIDITTDVISVCFKERRDLSGFRKLARGLLKPHGLPPRGRRNGSRHRGWAVHNWLIILISYFDFWVLAKIKIVNELPST